MDRFFSIQPIESGPMNAHENPPGMFAGTAGAITLFSCQKPVSQ
jgi:hypothetical protein